ncbi:threonine synthase [Halanaerobium hydrogeniformans]|uniref:Threonine synthase n=1 Tax=Halanaerobium hydrogeniformans TaxID=656519 RepID=E4RK42_HALHG|nr:threonine synthase [Halanaerobium hydrogeniformans]ADQ14594.1 threonine synthase [Halanaerobium hydrogeniformans]
MEYLSTRGKHKNVSAAEAIRLGLSPDGGLFVPAEIKKISREEIMGNKDKSYQEIAVWILEYFLSDYSRKEIEEAVNAAYSKQNFPAAKVTPLKKLDTDRYILELWHGPTAAFKDLALQIMPYLLVIAAEKSEIDDEIVILVATSGDTGKAALEGFKDVDGVKIIVFYPEAGVSRVQKDQMNTTTGRNTEVVSLQGNFDDCQNAVKEVFSDQKFKEKMERNSYRFSSANSINWGRLLPQIVYYFSAYFQLINDNAIDKGEEINITVPTGNFGNILAAYYAYKLGLPVNKFICASNDNKVLTDFLKTGVYDIDREFKKTISPSMDILISSNLERFLFEITEHDSEQINKWYEELKENNRFKIDSKSLAKIQDKFVGQFSQEDEAKQAIKICYQNFDYLIDPHTAVAYDSLDKYRKESSDLTTAVIDSTASPYKFSRAVLEALKDKTVEKDEYRIIEELKELTGTEIHRAIKGLENMEEKHQRNCAKDGVKAQLKDILAI